MEEEDLPILNVFYVESMVMKFVKIVEALVKIRWSVYFVEAQE